MVILSLPVSAADDRGTRHTIPLDRHSFQRFLENEGHTYGFPNQACIVKNVTLCRLNERIHVTLQIGTGQTGTQPNGYLVFLLPAVLGRVEIVKFLKVCFPGGLGTPIKQGTITTTTINNNSKQTNNDNNDNDNNDNDNDNINDNNDNDTVLLIISNSIR